MSLYVGVDGCKSGWFAVMLSGDNDWEVGVFEDISSLWKRCKSAALILIDIPIGLREGGRMERLCDKEARRLLGPRGPSVFPTPCRTSVYARTEKQAIRANQRRTGRGLSAQTLAIRYRVREVDCLLLSSRSARQRIREVHPELCFWGLAGGHPMEHSKTKDRKKAVSERMEALRRVYAPSNEVFESALSQFPRKEVRGDDVLDALAAAVTALPGKGQLRTLPVKPEKDARGLPMEMVYRVVSERASFAAAR